MNHTPVQQRQLSVLSHPTPMRKRPRLRKPTSWVKNLPLLATLICIGVGLTLCTQQQQAQQSSADPVLALIDTPDETLALQAIVKQQDRSPSAARAKYILGSEAIDRQQADLALKYLQGLEQDYPILTPQIIWKRAQAYELLNKQTELKSQLQLLNQKYAKSPVVVEAWNLLGKQDEKYWDLAIEKFPSHPRTLEIIQKKIAQTPNRSNLLLTLVKYLDDSNPRRLRFADRLVTEYPHDLKPTDWDLVGSIYWQNKIYYKVTTPLSRGTKTASNAYKIGRSHDLSQQPNEAKLVYQDLINQYPQSTEAADAIVNIAELSQNVEALTYLDRAIDKFPKYSVGALIKKAKILELYQNQVGAAATRSKMVELYPQTEEVATYRWQLATQMAKSKDFGRAWELAKQIVRDSPNSKYAPRAAFWIGKWARKLGKESDAKQAFTYTIVNYTRSYYSWRSAQYLGWDVGDFHSIKSPSPEIAKPIARLPLISGSDVLKELHIIGQDRDAWDLWQAELADRLTLLSADNSQPKTIDRLTQSQLLNGLEKYILSVVELGHIDDAKTPEERVEAEKIYQQPCYWYTAYPLAFIDRIQPISRQRQINPLLTISVIRQESKFSPVIKSPVGALGLMQVIPDTAKFGAYQMGLKKYELIDPSDNIRLGAWYLNFTHSQVKNNSVLAIAGYNAGPGNVSKWVKEFGTEDLDEFIEQIPFEETQNYVKNVLGNYWNYLRLYNPKISKQLANFLKSKE